MKLLLPLSQIAGAFVDFIYPPACSTCWRNLSKGEFYICRSCWDDFERVAPSETVIQAIETKFLADGVLEKIESVFLFEQDQRVRIAIHLLKYAGAERIADLFGSYIARKIANDEKLSMSRLIIPVPLHPSRKRERGYNQSELIARRVGEELQMSCEPAILERNRQTQTQTMFDAEGRRRNIEGAFTLTKDGSDRILGKNLLLVDDVITTGSTIRECAKVLVEGGARQVCAASAAITI